MSRDYSDPVIRNSVKIMFDWQLEQESYIDNFIVGRYCKTCFHSVLTNHHQYSYYLYCPYSHGRLTDIQEYQDYAPSGL